MTDDKYFAAYVESFKMVFSHSEDLVYLKDANFRYQAVTDGFCSALGVDAANQMMNKTTSELTVSPDLIECLPKFEKQDLQVQKDFKCGIYLDVITNLHDVNAYVVYKKPIINPETNNFVGIRGELTNLLLPHIAKLLFKVHGVKGLLLTQKNSKNAFKEYNLTPMQHIVLFLCLNNYSYTEIAVLISEFVQPVTPIQVNGHLEELKLIFRVRTKNQLIEKAIGLNFNSFLPRDLFKLATINLTGDVTSMIDLSRQAS